MLPIAEAFEYEYWGCDLIHGRGCVERLGAYLADQHLDRALLVCGLNVAANDDLMDPIRAGLGDRLAGVFDGKTPDKQAEADLPAVAAFIVDDHPMERAPEGLNTTADEIEAVLREAW
jgi:alcohol dehydrogenase